MGGDDLGSEDEYLFEEGLIEKGDGRGTHISSDNEDEDGVSMSYNENDVNNHGSSSKKRKGEAGMENTTDDADDDDLSSKKRQKNSAPLLSTNKLMIQAGRGIALDSADSQATFLNTLYSHSIKLADSKSAADGENDESSSDTFSFQSHLYSHPETIKEDTKQFQHKNLEAFLKSGPLPSMKRLKNWKHAHSPMVLVVTLSARRSVDLMKQLNPLKLPIAKLFAKHMSIDDQAAILKGAGKAGGIAKGGKGRKNSDRCYSLAVGTPGRLLKLLNHGKEEPGSEGLGALRLKHTEVVIFDCHEDSKGWTVCTLKDTSKELMEFMKEGVVPELEKRKGKIKLAMF
mmetsp:Transcript_25344/g.45713  ORF Transcript_25344/g.45713 Transcript_25344/m.45713 type:complete len:343 (-) Transcript_25344:109-1137(-)|eukprot:CAMPEP_0201921068 /NCGR_PEP_ID=MMETSP0903-20130614/9508_1 /ASSEMBLY_ACC=CAM_ASM_000552 /TAXON_ID=420261 /ORGANISM="Thalassiosira antarctica, Strain CCMP982" /LENGTH=342 /DNA_ID=CAMNT_0048457961 /DNA_START=96 /DNA_END=1124 /DNA_ORIENTATION=+